MGMGTATCVQFATEYRADAGIEQRFFDWAQGLMSGINDALEDTMGKYRDLNSMPIAQQKEILRAYCDDHPAATYRNGINDMPGRADRGVEFGVTQERLDDADIGAAFEQMR
jgi:hypothetical protein